MGSKKRSRKTSFSDDLEEFDDLEENGKLMEEEEEDEEETFDLDDEKEEGEEEDDKEVAEDENEGEEDVQYAEMEELEKEYTHLRHQEQDILKNLKRHKDEDIVKGQAVKNQKALWDKTLEFRFLLQKAFSSSNRLPQEPIRALFCDSNEEVTAAYADLIRSSKKTLASLMELQETLLEKNPSISQSSNVNSLRSVKKHSKESNNSDAESDEEWSQISQMYKRIAPFRDKSIDKWQRKTQVTSGAAAIKGKLQAFNQNISEQVASYMRDPSRMMKQMQQSRSTVGVFGTVLEQLGNAKGEEASPNGDAELLDDTEFYQQLLREFFETIDPTSSEMAFYALKKLQIKKRKNVDRRASKSRKIRFNVHEKIVNFMAPQPMNIPPMAPKLFENLFGLKTEQPASSV